MPLSRRHFLQQASVAAAALGLPRVSTAGRIRVGSDDPLSLSNELIRASWELNGGRFTGGHVEDKAAGIALSLGRDAFQFTLADGGSIAASELQVEGEPRIVDLAAEPRASRYAEQLPGQALILSLRDPQGRLHAEWRAILRRGSRYLRQEVVLKSLAGALPVREIVMVDLALPGAEVIGSVRGSPVVSGPWFVAMEHPLSTSTAGGGRVRCVLPRELPLRPGTRRSRCRRSSAPCAAASCRRDFLGYVERERAHPVPPFLHYNSWYDLGYFTKYAEAGALAVIDAFGDELHVEARCHARVLPVRRRLGRPEDAVALQRRISRTGSPACARRREVRRGARRVAVALGRLRQAEAGPARSTARRRASKPTHGGFALSGPKYYKRFHDTCVEFIRRYGVNQFKFDGTGNAVARGPGQRVRQRFRRDDLRSSATCARIEARPLRQSHHRHVSVAVLAALRRLDLARRRGPIRCRRRHVAAAVDDLPRRRHLRRHRPEGTALSRSTP